MPLARRLRFPVGLVAALFSLAACAGDDGLGAGNHDPALTLRVTPKIDSLGIGLTTQLTARVTDAAGIQQSATIAWMSLNNTIATVTGNGLVTAVAAGRVGVIATIGTAADTATIVVVQGELVIEPNAVITAVGEQLQFSATTRAGKSASASGLALRWTSSDTTVARVDESGNVTAVGAGDAVLIASVGTQQGSAALTVKQKDISSIRVTPTTSSVYSGGKTQLQATAYDDAGRAIGMPNGAKWTSSNSTSLTVDDNGLATGKSSGSSVVSVRVGSKAATASVNTLPVPVATVTASLGASTLDAGQTTQTNVVLKDADGNTLTGRTIAYQSSNPALATVNASGVVAAVAKGSVTITAISEGKTGTAPLTIAAKSVTTVTVSPNPASATVGQSAQLTAVASDAQGGAMTGRTFTWSSSAPSVATVNAAGLVTAVGAGSATITAIADGISGTATFSATAITAASVTVTPTSSTLQVNGTAQLSATAYDAGGNVLSSRVPTWSSSNPTVATVSNAGRVTAVSQGNTTITASVDGKSATAGIGVSAPPPAPVATVSVTLGAQSLNVGQTAQASAVLRDASNNVLSGRSITWSSAAPELATVSASGVVTAVAAGSATIIATSEGQSGSATLVVSSAAPAPVATVVLSAASTSMTVGQSQTIAVTLQDAMGHTLSGRTIAWSSSSPSVLSVSPSGQVQANAAGSAVVTATSEGKSGTVTITVVSAVVPVSTVGVSGSATSVLVGQTAQFTATPKDAIGHTLTGRAVSWSSSAPNVASVNASGTVTGVAAGTAVINANVEGVIGSLAMTVTAVSAPPPPPPPTGTAIATIAELPRSVPALTFAKATRVVQVNGGDLQAALNAAQPGDSLVLSGTFTGNFTLPTRPCGAGITITSAGSLPPAGTRMTPTLAAGLAKIVSPNSVAALKTTNPTCGWRLVGLEIVYNGPTSTENYGAVWLGDGGWIAGGDTQASMAQVPQDFLLERLYIHTSATGSLRRCLYINSGRTIVRDSWMSECHSNGGDSQAILGCNGPGPYLIENNYLEGGHENILFGGCDPVSEDLTPSDITIRKNHVKKNLAWRTASPKWSTKNLFELKNSKRVLVEQNVFENVWPDAQEGMAIVIKTATATCQTCYWEGTTDVTFRWNIVRNSAVGLNLQALDMSPGQINTQRHVARVTVTDNLFDQIGAEGRAAAMLFTHDLSDIAIYRNTFKHDPSVGTARGSGLTMDYGNGAARRMDFQSNIIPTGAYWFFYTGGAIGSAAMQAMVGDGSWGISGNALVGDGSLLSKFPSGNTSPSSYPTAPGVDLAELTRRTSGVVVAP